MANNPNPKNQNQAVPTPTNQPPAGTAYAAQTNTTGDVLTDIGTFGGEIENVVQEVAAKLRERLAKFVASTLNS